ncbi:receptor-like protein EIX2 [Argentina anserina]|uniref:receptor-like protein EIX2 n=1 Tax=Argentina anserina TaxID=57926 RepID=UPI00217687F4|nr:receptor-like protein EIX2 [Potentilla anserina]
MELGNWFKHTYAMSFVLLLHIIASLSLGLNHSNMTGTCVERERDALLAIKGDLVDDYKFYNNPLSSWGSKDCCAWERVQCDHQTGHVIQLQLGGLEVISPRGKYMRNVLHGEVSPKIIELQYLEYLDLSFNFFNASQIPVLICSLSNLRHLNLHSNLLIGSKIPELVGNLTKLRYLDLSYNGLMTNKIPVLICPPSNLRYLDLGYNYLMGSEISKLIGNLTNLRYLDLSSNALGGETPYLQLGNLTYLQYLNLGYQSNFRTNVIGNLKLSWLLHLSSLKYLDLSWANLSKSSDWVETISKLPNLRNLTLRGCDLPSPILSTLSHINSSNSLVSVDLSGNSIASPSTFKWLRNYNTTLYYLDLSFNQLSGLSGLDPNTFANMSSLEVLVLSDNPLEGEIPTFISQLCSLRYLSISRCNLTGQLSKSVQRWSACPQISLQNLYLSDNHLAGPFPNLTYFSLLEVLYLSTNKLSGRILDSIR